MPRPLVAAPASAPAARLPERPFFVRAQERTPLARERLFVQGQRRTGLVGEPFIQSWQRCLVAHRRPADKRVFEPVTVSRRQLYRRLGAAGARQGG